MDADADGEAVYAHYALHRLKILPSTLVALPLRERAFIGSMSNVGVERKLKKFK